MPIKTSIMTITPMKAAEFLKHNSPDQRRARKSHVDYLAGVMRRGEWTVTHLGIAFDNKGKLGDGQHRLMAVVASGVTVKMMVTTGLPKECFPNIDGGAKRTHDDIIRISKAQVQIASFLSRLLTGQSRTSTVQVWDTLDMFQPNIKDFSEHCRTTRRCFSASPIRAAAVLRMVLHPEEKQYILDLYRNLVSRNDAGLPAIGHAFINQVERGVVETSRDLPLFSRAFYLFDPAKRHERDFDPGNFMNTVSFVRDRFFGETRRLIA